MKLGHGFIAGKGKLCWKMVYVEINSIDICSIYFTGGCDVEVRRVGCHLLRAVLQIRCFSSGFIPGAHYHYLPSGHFSHSERDS